MKTRKMDESQRGCGFTTNQMKLAPLNALYIWPVLGSIDYAKSLANKLGRNDLEIVCSSVFEQKAYKLRGRTFTAIILDHACEPNNDDYDTLKLLRALCVKRKS